MRERIQEGIPFRRGLKTSGSVLHRKKFLTGLLSAGEIR
jgi:hypothetical protein